MPHIVQYLARVRPSRAYDDFELDRLQEVFQRACSDLHIEIGDQRRETVAGLVFHLAEEMTDADEMLARVTHLFSHVSEKDPRSGSFTSPCLPHSPRHQHAEVSDSLCCFPSVSRCLGDLTAIDVRDV